MGYWDMIKLLGNKDVMVFLIQMLFKRWKKQFITKGGWKTPKSLFRMAISKQKIHYTFTPIHL